MLPSTRTTILHAMENKFLFFHPFYIDEESRFFFHAAEEQREMLENLRIYSFDVERGGGLIRKYKKSANSLFPFYSTSGTTIYIYIYIYVVHSEKAKQI